MPGLTGLAAASPSPGAGLADAAARMAVTLRRSPRHTTRALEAEGFAATLTVFPGLEGASLAEDGPRRALFYGEWHNLREMLPEAASPAAALLLLDAEPGGLERMMRGADGWFNFVVFDPATRRLRFGNDRHGFMPLYLGRAEGLLAWAAETKAFAAVPGFDRQPDVEAMREILDRGWLSSERTLLQGVAALPPSTLRTVRLDDPALTFEDRRVWTEADLPKVEGTDDELAEEGGRLFRRAVERYTPTNGFEPVVFLSGGLDSRAIFAAVPPPDRPLLSLTFGQENALDRVIAARVAQVRPGRHVNRLLDHDTIARDWRTYAWVTDGLVPVHHMNGRVFRDELEGRDLVHLSGFLGDALIGGSYAAYAPQATEWHMIRTRGRRLIGATLVETMDYCHTRTPFLESAFLDFSMGIPLERRAVSGLYETMLLRSFPEYFRRIPSGATRVPLGSPYWKARAARIRLRLGEELRKRLGRDPAPTPAGPNAPFAAQVRRANTRLIELNRLVWREPARAALAPVLDAAAPLYRDLLPDVDGVALFEEARAGRVPVERATALLTLEIALQQTYAGRLLPDE